VPAIAASRGIKSEGASDGEMTAMVATAMDWGEGLVWRRVWGLSLAAWAFVLAGLLAFIGLLWDGAWHGSWGRDSFFIPPHKRGDFAHDGYLARRPGYGITPAAGPGDGSNRAAPGAPRYLDCPRRHDAHVRGSRL
jgi:hypothetical protein